GYCFEASQKLLNWASNHDEVKYITARCELDNINSKNVLVKLGFQMDHRDTELIYWKYSNNGQSL
ncbi:GNAT family N-acetyltransferase, partial [Bacillus cereus]